MAWLDKLVGEWSDLREFGNSSIAKSSIFIPIVGYFILFNNDIIKYLSLNSNFCNGSGCSISWRMYFLYFGLCSVAVGTAIYSWKCPKVVKRFSRAQEFFEVTKVFYSHPQTLVLLLDEIREMTGSEYEDPLNLRQNVVVANAALNAAHFHTLVGIMFEFYKLKDNNKIIYRCFIRTFYIAGAVFILIPTIYTFGQVVRKACENF